MGKIIKVDFKNKSTKSTESTKSETNAEFVDFTTIAQLIQKHIKEYNLESAEYHAIADHFGDLFQDAAEMRMIGIFETEDGKLSIPFKIFLSWNMSDSIAIHYWKPTWQCDNEAQFHGLENWYPESAKLLRMFCFILTARLLCLYRIYHHLTRVNNANYYHDRINEAAENWNFDSSKSYTDECIDFLTKCGIPLFQKG